LEQSVNEEREKAEEAQVRVVELEEKLNVEEGKVSYYKGLKEQFEQ